MLIYLDTHPIDTHHRPVPTKTIEARVVHACGEEAATPRRNKQALLQESCVPHTQTPSACRDTTQQLPGYNLAVRSQQT